MSPSHSSPTSRLPHARLLALLAGVLLLAHWTATAADADSSVAARGLYLLLLVAPLVLVCARAITADRDRWEWAAVATGLALWVAGIVVQVVLDLRGGHLSFPSAVDGLWLSMYPLALVALGSVARKRLRRLSLSVVLDALIVALVLAALATLMVLPGVAENASGLRLTGQIANFAYPIADTMLVAMAVTLAVLTGWRCNRVWATLGVGAVALLAADATWALTVAAGKTGGSLLSQDAIYPLWPLALAVAAWLPASRDCEETVDGGARLLSTTFLAVIAALTMLVANEWTDVPAASVVLAAAALLAAIHRTALALTTSLRAARDAARSRTRVGKVAHALADRQLVLHFQPLVDVRTGAVHGAEALLRWPHADGFVEPGRFLPAVERSDLIGPLTDYVIDGALAQLAVWRAAGHDIGVSVNLAAANLDDDDLPRRVAAALRRHGLPADSLTLEITETTAIDDAHAADAVLVALDRLGVELSVDDFGTGHSSLARLARFPIDEVKVDRSFVMEMHTTDRPIVATTIELAHTLGLRVVAEGVEDAATLNALHAMGCDVVQGYFLSRPLAPADFAVWLDAREQQPGREHEEIRSLLSRMIADLGMDAAFVSQFVDDQKMIEMFEGIDTFGPIHEGATLPRSHTYCDRVVRGVFPNVIPRARRDHRTAALPVTISADLGAYVGVALHDHEGRLYGALCCISHSDCPGLGPRDLEAVAEVAKRLRPLLGGANLTLARTPV